MEKEEILEEEKVEVEPKKEKKNKKNKQVEELTEKLKSLEEETLRAKADLINYRKRKDDEVANLLKYCNADIIMLLLPVLDNFERVINKEDIPDSVERGIIKSVEDDFRNSQSYGKEAVQKLASEYLKDVIEKMRRGYTSGGKWKDGYDLDKALAYGSAMIKDPTGRKSYIHLSDLSDKLQQKIKAWARNRIETLYDFDDDEE